MDADENIFGLNVSMHDMLLVKIFESSRHLGDVLGGFPLGESVFLSQVFVQLAFAGEFQDQKHSLAVVEVSKQSQDVRMSQVGLDFDFTPDLLLDLALL